MSITSEAADAMLGNGWYDFERLVNETSMPYGVAQQAIQRVNRSGNYNTEMRRKGCRNEIKVISVKGVMKPDRQTKLYRLAIFGERL